MEAVVVARPARAGAARMRAVDVATLVAVALVVLLVSLPRLRDLALRENEGDARHLTARLGGLVARSEAPERTRVQALLAGTRGPRRQLDDAEFLADGRLLRRHGYLFEVVPLAEGAAAVRAWPAVHGQTGLAVFAWAASTALVGHPNRDGRWSGERPPPVPGEPDFSAAGWLRLDAP